MTEIHRIKCSWNSNGEMEFAPFDTWEGKILLEEDGWFEGIVRDYGDKKDSFVFGVFKQDKGIELHKIGPMGIDKPVLFHGIRKMNGSYEGSYEDDGAAQREFQGSSRIETEEIFNSTFLAEAKDVENRIKRFKDPVQSEVMENYRKMREKRTIACEMLSRYFDGEPYDTYLDAMNSKKEEGFPFGEELARELDLVVIGTPKKRRIMTPDEYHARQANPGGEFLTSPDEDY